MKKTSLRKLHRKDRFYWRWTRVVGILLSIVVITIWMALLAVLAIEAYKFYEESIPLVEKLKDLQKLQPPTEQNEIKEWIEKTKVQISELRDSLTKTLSSANEELNSIIKFLFKTTFTIITVYLAVRILANVLLAIRDFHDYRSLTHDAKLYVLNVVKRTILITCIIIMIVQLDSIKDTIDQLVGVHLNKVTSLIGTTVEKVKDIKIEINGQTEEEIQESVNALTIQFKDIVDNVTNGFNDIMSGLNDTFANSTELVNSLAKWMLIFIIASGTHFGTILILGTLTAVLSDLIKVQDKKEDNEEKNSWK